MNTTFLNRRHAVQGSQVLALVFALLGVTFAALDWTRFGCLHAVSGSFLAASIGSAIAAALLGRKVGAGGKPLAFGAALAWIYLLLIWLLARTGG